MSHLRNKADVCDRCGRPIQDRDHDPNYRRHHAPVRVARCYVEHAYYGCDTGCCGHEVIGEDAEGEIVYRQFEFDHPYVVDHDRWPEWARELALSHLPRAEFVWEECEVYDG